MRVGKEDTLSGLRVLDSMIAWVGSQEQPHGAQCLKCWKRRLFGSLPRTGGKVRDRNNTKRGIRPTDSAISESAELGGETQTRTNSEPPIPSRSTQFEDSCERSALSRVLGVDEIAAIFGCSTAKINRRARNHELPAFKFGKSWYVREQDLARYIEQAVESTLHFHQKAHY